MSGTGPWTITATSVGTCPVIATRQGDARYEPESSTPQAVEFTRLPQADLAVSNAIEATIGQPLVLSTSGGSGTGAVTWWPTRGSISCTVRGSDPHRLTAESAGWCSLYAIKGADDRYSAKQSPVVHISWAKGDQVPLVLTTTSGRFGTPLPVEYTGGSGTGTVAMETADGTATGCAATRSWPEPFMLTSRTAGTCVVTVSKPGDTGYLDASSAPTTVTFTKEPQSGLRMTGPLDGTLGLPCHWRARAARAPVRSPTPRPTAPPPAAR